MGVSPGLYVIVFCKQNISVVLEDDVQGRSFFKTRCSVTHLLADMR